MFSPLVIAVILLLVGLAIVFLELFLPSGGILGVLAVAAIVASVIAAMMHPDRVWGLSFAVGEIVVVALLVAAIIRWWPESSIGKRIVPELPKADEILPDNASLKQLVGKLGRTKSMMLPSGAVVVEGRTVNAITEGMAIDAGETVKVIEVRGSRVVVRKVEMIDTPQAASRPDDLLSRPLEELGLEGLGDA